MVHCVEKGGPFIARLSLAVLHLPCMPTSLARLITNGLPPPILLLLLLN